MKKQKRNNTKPASKIYYLAIQDDPKSKKMDVKMFLKDGKVGLLNRVYEKALHSSKMTWQIAIISYGVDKEGNEYREVQFVNTTTPVSKSEVDLGKIAENVIHLTTTPEEREEIYARAYIISPKNPFMKLPDLMRVRKDQLAMTESEIADLDDLHKEEPIVIEMAVA